MLLDEDEMDFVTLDEEIRDEEKKPKRPDEPERAGIPEGRTL